MRRRRKGIFSELMSLIGSMTHWIFRGLLSFVFEKMGIYVAPEIQKWIAYIFTGALLFWLGVWGKLGWWPWTWFNP